MFSYSFEGNKRLWTSRDVEENKKIFSEKSKPTDVKTSQDINTIFVPNTEYDVEKWPLEQIIRLLRFYAAHRCLWDVSCKDNRNRKMRHAAIVDITAALNTGVNEEQVVQKINILRNTYRYEKKRIKQKIRRGLGASTKLKWFALADAFLRKIPKKGKKDPSNSDSDLEDTVVFTVNTESMPLHQEFCITNLQETQYNEQNSFYSQQKTAAEEIASADDVNICSHIESPIWNKTKQEINLSQVYDIRNSAKKIWSFEDTTKFLQLLQSHAVSLESVTPSCDILALIAKEINHSYKAVEKRWLILQKVCNEEKLKKLANPEHKPKYKWWPLAEKLLADQKPASTGMAEENTRTESIFLPLSENQESNDDQEYENRFLQNPIPSVAPLSNMTEAWASLFNDKDDCENLSQVSATNSLALKRTNISSKIVCYGLEDDLLEGKWSLKHSVKFLRLYGVHRCLWDLNHPDYRSRPLRNAAIEDIAASMGHGLTASYVAKKIKIFRITYMQQRKRLLDASKKGEKPEILLKWFPLADSFLRPHIGLRSIKSDAKEMPQFDYQYVYANLNLIDPELLNDFREEDTQTEIEIHKESKMIDFAEEQSG